MNHIYIPFLALAVTIYSCKESNTPVQNEKDINPLAAEYVRLGLAIGQYDEAFVDAYYGPDSLKPAGIKLDSFPKDSFLRRADVLLLSLEEFGTSASNDTIKNRAGWLSDQLIAYKRRIRIFAGENANFDEEAKDLFGTTPPVYDEAYFQKHIASLDTILPGTGSVQDRFQTLANRFIIPKEKLDTVFQAAIAECRLRTKKYYQLPSEESFKLEFVTDKSWNGYNWYKGNYTRLIQINTDLSIFLDRAIDVGSHESYPGHHVYNMLLEKNLYADQGLIEISLYPLYSPTSLIAEGTANYGIDVVFPGNDKITFSKNVLLPLAGLDTTGIGIYFQANAIKGKLNYVRNEVARGMINGTMTDEQALEWLVKYGLYNEETALKSISFIKTYRTYVMNYNYGMDLVREYVESKIESDPTPENRWKIFGELMSRQVRIGDLKN